MIMFDAPVTPVALTTFTREIPTPRGSRLLQLFGRKDSQTNTIDWAEILQTNDTAEYRTFDGRIHVSARDSGSEKRVRMLPLSDSLNQGEYETLQLRFAQTGGTNIAALENAIYNDAEKLTKQVLNRLELAMGDVLSDGKLTLNGEGGISGSAGEADFGVPAGNLPTFTTAWTDKAAPLFSNLISWVDAYVDVNGAPPASMLPSLQTLRLMQTNTEIINQVKGAAAQVGRVDRTDLNGLLASEGLPQVLDPFDERVNYRGASTRVIPANKLVFMPSNLDELAHFEYGVSATALELVDSNAVDFSFEDAPGITGVVIKEGPPFRKFTFVDAVAMPVLDNARLLMTATVF